MTKDKILRVFFFSLVGLVVVNLLLLDFFFFSTKKEEVSPAKIELTTPTTPQASPADICGLACQEAIAKAIATLAAQPKPAASPVAKTQGPSEIYIPVGAGSTTSLDWIDIPGAEVYIDTTKYGKIKEAYFEAQLRVPTANGSVCARVFNQTDKSFVFSSEVCSTSQKGERVTSPKINLYSGNKLYRVQMRVTMSYEGILDLGRIKLVWE